MALDNYSDLQGAIADWLERPDISARIPDFIRMAELQLGRLLRVVDMEAISSRPLVADQLYYALPDRSVELRNLFIDSAPQLKLKYLTPEQLITEYPTTTGEIVAYTIVDGQIKLNSTSGNDNLMVSYWRRFEHLTDEKPTGFYTTEAPDLLLHMSLIQAEQYVVNPEMVPMWKEQASMEIEQLNNQAERLRYSGGSLQMRYA